MALAVIEPLLPEQAGSVCELTNGTGFGETLTVEAATATHPFMSVTVAVKVNGVQAILMGITGQFVVALKPHEPAQL
jgi:hypothetical protein